jgi:hypothetical protein
MNMYVIDNHDLAGRLLRRFVRDVSWFTPWNTDIDRNTNEGMAESFRRARLVGVMQSQDGLLWTMVHTMDEKNPFPPGFDFRSAFSATRVPDFDLRHVTIVEAIDPESAQVLASIRLQGQASPMTDGLVAQFVPDSVNARAAKIIRLSLAR